MNKKRNRRLLSILILVVFMIQISTPGYAGFNFGIIDAVKEKVGELKEKKRVINLTPSTVVASGTVTSEIGGIDLVVKSVHQTTDAVVANGNFTTVVSNKGTQLLFVVDSDNKYRGLTLSIPDPTLKQVNIMTTDATSVALSLLFLTPGITTVDSTETQERILKLKSLPSFNSLVDFLKTNLPNKSLSDLVKETQLSISLENCINDWLQTQSTSIKSYTSQGDTEIVIDPPKDNFKVSCEDLTNLATITFRLSNKGWRYVNVHRGCLDDSLNEKEVRSIYDGLDSMRGAIPFSWGSIFTNMASTPTIKDDPNPINFLNSDIQKVQYWIVGPGWKHSEDTLPPSINRDNLDACGLTIVMYTVFPIIDLILGGASLFEKAPEVAKEVWNSVKSLVSLEKVINASDEASLATALVDAGISIIAAGLATGIFVSAGIISAEMAKVISIIIATFSLPLCAVNFLIPAIEFFLVSPIAKIEAVKKETVKKNILVLTRNTQSLDAEEQKITTFLSQNGYTYKVADSTMITNGLNVNSYKIIYFRTGAEPIGYNKTTILNSIKSAVEGGSSLFVEYYGSYLAQYLNWGTVKSGGWYPVVYDKIAYVKPITSHSIFNEIPMWDPPTKPDKTEQLLWSLNAPGTYDVKNLDMLERQQIKFWGLNLTYGWTHQPINSNYCQSWGGCKGERSVHEFYIDYALHGSGKLINIYALNNNAPIEKGNAGVLLMKNLLKWAEEN